MKVTAKASSTYRHQRSSVIGRNLFVVPYPATSGGTCRKIRDNERVAMTTVNAPTRTLRCRI